MRKLATILLAGAAVMAVPAMAAPAAAPTTTAPTTATSNPAAADAAGNPTSSPAGTSAANSPASTSQTASAAGAVTAGATVKDTQGGTVGTIESVDGQYAVLATTKNKVRLPLSSFGKGADGPILAMTQAQVDAAAASAAAKTAKP
jgi:hypothetical protein